MLAPLAVAGAVLLKLAGSLKFLGIFVAVGGYALIWGWRFGIGFVLLILVHEMGHYVEARRQGLNPQAPYSSRSSGRTSPSAISRSTRGATRSSRSPAPSRVAWRRSPASSYGNAVDSDLLRALAYVGFLLNLFNLIPIGFLDGGHILRSWRILKAGGGRANPADARRLAGYVGAYTVAVIAALALGMVASHVPQTRL